MPYGSTSYTRIEDARSVTHAVRKKGPGGSEIRLVPNHTPTVEGPTDYTKSTPDKNVL